MTEEQKKRIEENRKRALEIRQQKQAEMEKLANDVPEKGGFVESMGGFISTADDESEQHKKRKPNYESGAASPKGQKITNQTINNRSNSEQDEDEESLEDFEQGASEYITKADAQRIYCLPQGTLAVCSYTERENPHKKGWSTMKLYSRSEVRRRARTRFGGKDGLIQERERRKENRFNKDLEEMKDIFS